MPTSLGPAEILVILVVALIVLGPKRLPEAGRQVGKAITEVRKWSQGFQDELRTVVDPDASRPSYPTLPPPPAKAATTPPATNGSAAPGNGLAPGAEPAPVEPLLAEPPASPPSPAAVAPAEDAAAESRELAPPAPAGPPSPAPSDPAGPPAGEPPRS